jgi:hypothetical protein
MPPQTPDPTKLSPELIARLQEIEREERMRDPAVQQAFETVKALTEANQLLDQIKKGIDNQQNKKLETDQEIGQTLKELIAQWKTEMAELQSSNIQAFATLSKEIQLKLTDVEKAVNVNVPAPKVDVAAPNVNVSAPKVDTKGIERAISNITIPAMPEIPDFDTSQIEKNLLDLKTVMKEVRDRKIPIPQFPNQVKVVNPDGSTIGQGSTINTVSANATALNTDVFPALDVSAYSSASIQITGTWAGTITFQVSDDGVNYVSQVVANSITTGGSVLSTTTSGVYSVPLFHRYLRVRMTAYTSGTAVGTTVLFGSTRAVQAVGVAGTISNNANTSSATIQALAAQTASGNSAISTIGTSYRNAVLTLNCTASSGTGQTLNVNMQVSDDGGTTWYQAFYPNTATPITFTQLTGVGSQAISVTGMPLQQLRAQWVIGGTTPSFTFAVKGIYSS